MAHTSSSALTRFRIVAFTEGLSYLALLGIAMPLKYIAGIPMAVKVVGWVHGLLFILYLVTLVHAAVERRWSATFSVAAFVASLIPGATFYLERILRRDDEKSDIGAAEDAG